MQRMATRRAALDRGLAWLRGRFRASEAWLIGLAVAVGLAAGWLAVIQSELAHALQLLLYRFAPDSRLSAQHGLALWSLIWLPLGGLALGLLTLAAKRIHQGPLTDVVEANALYGGRMSLRGTLVICLQTLVSNGFGASVGLEAAYAQAGGSAASTLGSRLRLRRQDLRTLVGAGAGAAIGAAFGAPLTGAFYAFEVVIGSYAPSIIAPVAAAALAASASARLLGAAPYSIHVQVVHSPDPVDFLLYSGLGLLCGAFGIALMQLVASGEKLFRSTPGPAWLRPVGGGLLMAALAAASPQVLSSGHGALHLDLTTQMPLLVVATLILLKSLASVVSLSTGFRGGLFFASLFLGALLGKLFAGALSALSLPLGLWPENAALVGMGALATAVVGAPLTMSFLVLEATRDFGVAAATLAASVVAGSLVRERFGYSLSTWRLHLRGESIRSARDVGWVRSLTAGRMMRTDVPRVAASTRVEVFRRRFPLGSVTRVILIDDAQHYAGIVTLAAAYSESAVADQPIREVAQSRDEHLAADMNISEVMRYFDRTETEELAVVDGSGEVLGLLAEVYVARRYARELEALQQSLFGES
jgi:CIC family chloride channel protein